MEFSRQEYWSGLPFPQLQNKKKLELFAFQPEEQNPVGLQREEGRPAGHHGQATTVGSPRLAPGCTRSWSAAQPAGGGLGPRGSQAPRMSVTRGLARPITGKYLWVKW